MPEAVWRVLGRSAVGTSHVGRGEGCQDAFATLAGPAFTVLVAADGAGSARFAALAAQTAAKVAAEHVDKEVRAELDLTAEGCAEVLKGAFSAARASLCEIASVDDAPDRENALSDYSTTLLVALVTPTILATRHIGDGAVVTRSVDGALDTWSPPEHGEHLNETIFLVSPDAVDHERARAGSVEGIESIAMFTDGLEYLGLRYRDKEAHAGFFDPLFAFAHGEEAAGDVLESWLSSKEICKATDDDKTLILAVRPQEVRP